MDLIPAVPYYNDYYEFNFGYAGYNTTTASFEGKPGTTV